MMDEGWTLVSENTTALSFIRQFGKKNARFINFSLVLEKTGNSEKFSLQHPSYDFHSSVAHFRSVQKDSRLSLNKVYLISLIRALKRSEIWQDITNKDFLVLNEWNPKSNKARVNSELKVLLS